MTTEAELAEAQAQANGLTTLSLAVTPPNKIDKQFVAVKLQHDGSIAQCGTADPNSSVFAIALFSDHDGVPTVACTRDDRTGIPCLYDGAAGPIPAGSNMSLSTTLPGRFALDPSGAFVLMESASGIDSITRLASLTGGTAGTLATGEVIIYADAVNGNDLNPGTSAQPVKTLRQAQELIPASWKRNMQIHLAPGVYSITGTTGGPPGWGSHVGPDASSPMLIGSYTNELGDRTVSGGSADGGQFADNTLSISVDQYRGAWALCISGANAGQRRIIKSNSADGLFKLAVPFFSAVSPGDVMQIQLCAVQIDVIDVAFMAQVTILCQGIRFNLVGGAPTGTFRFARWECNGCEIAGNGGNLIVEANSNFASTGFPNPYGTSNPLNPLMPPTGDPGCFVHDVFLGVFDPGSEFNMIGVMDDIFALNQGGLLDLGGVSARQMLIDGFGPESLTVLEPLSNGIGTFPCTFDGNSNFGPGAPLVLSERGCRFFGVAVDLSNSTGDAVVLTGRSTAHLEAVTGTGNTGFGINAQQQAAVFYNPAATGNPTMVTGTAGDVLVASNPPLTYAAIDAGPGFTDAVALIRVESN
jgi:hypothetical protein